MVQKLFGEKNLDNNAHAQDTKELRAKRHDKKRHCKKRLIAYRLFTFARFKASCSRLVYAICPFFVDFTDALTQRREE
jgi:hypothetical protein